MTKTDQKLTVALFVALMCAVLAGAGCGPGQAYTCDAERLDKYQACSAAPSSSACRKATHALEDCSGL